MRFQTLLLALVPSLGLLACTHKDTGDDSAPVDDSDSAVDTGDGKQRFVVLHTNDTHSHLVGWGPNAEYTPDSLNDDPTVGGVARAMTLISEIRASTTDQVLLFDAGDWMNGDVFMLLAQTNPAELQMFQALGYDAITLGNHELDQGPGFLGDMIAKADDLGVTVPIIASNVVANPDDPADDSLEAALDSGRIQSNMVLTLENGLRVGLFGLIGDDAQSITPGIAPASFAPQTETAQNAVADLQSQGVDLVFAISHSGVTEDPATSPDNLIAQAAPEINLIVGGHSHTALPGPLTEGDTTILQAGSYGQYVGEVHLAWDGATLEVESYTLHELDDTILGDSAVSASIEQFQAELDAGPLADLGYTTSQPIMNVPGNVQLTECTESGLGNFITDAYLTVANASDPADPVDFSFEAQGVIRDNMLAGNTGIQGFSDVFRVLPLGSGADDVPGYDLVDFYVTASEIQDVCEVTASISPSYGCNYFIEVGGLRCNLDMSHGSFNRARSIDRWNGTACEPMDSSAANTELYHVVVDSYVASLMGILGGLTYDAITITAKDATGVPYASVDEMRFDADPATAGVQELKLWQALLQYGQAQPDTDGDGLSNVPDVYLGAQGRIVGY
jgi:5'-nucleotidase